MGPGSYIVRQGKASGHWRNRWEFRKPFDAALQTARIDGVTFHDLRRTFASLLASNGVSLYKISQWLGDGQAVVQRHYAHLQAQDSDINRAWK
jgi:integrase